MSAAVWGEPPTKPNEACAECARLDEQERAAYLAGDGSRRTDVRVMARRHRQREHGEAASGFMPSQLAGPFMP
ncbi:hypothetical protein ABH940_001233 [Streptacidiphilus sp. BW17]